MADQFEGADEAHKACEANTSPRYKRLEKLERWSDGTQYQGMQSWWDDDVPLWERAPCVVYPIVQIAVQSNVDLVLGEGRFPTFSAKPAEDEQDSESGTDEESAEQIDRFLSEYHRLCRFRAHCRDAFYAAQCTGTAVAIHGARNGKPFANLIPAKWGNPKLGSEGETLELDIRYPYVEEYRKANGVWAVRAKLYRRRITATDDVTFFPADARTDGVEPDWKPDPSLSATHGFGFCPVVWYPFMRGCVPVNVIDGKAIHAHLLDEIRAHDIAVSQRHRGALLSEPQPVEIGVSQGYNPTELARAPSVASVDEHGKVVGAFRDPGPMKSARKKGPGYVWQYQDPQTKVQYLTFPEGALKAQDDNARDLRMKLQEGLGVVFLDPENIKFAATTSGKALEAIKQKQIDRCDQFRDDLRDGFLLPSVDMQLRIAQKLGASLRVAGSEKLAAALAKFSQPEVPRALG